MSNPLGPGSTEPKSTRPNNKRNISGTSMATGMQESTNSAIEGEGRRENFDQMNREELISKIRAMELHIRQLRNIIAKSDGVPSKKYTNRKHREFNHDKYRRRHILLRFCYLGWDYQGLASQEDTPHTIEAEMFRCLQLTRLVRDRQTANYHRCGRTDKGVSAFSQVISLDVRSQQPADPSDPDAAATLPPDQEINYPSILNKVLPPEIRVLAWSPAEPEASARFDCRARTYKYFFPRGSLDLQAMQDAAGRLCGHHDFRNLCKMDVGNGVVGYHRRLEHVQITTLNDRQDGYQMCQLEVRGNAFLWHQIRCMVAVLFLVGERVEDASIIDQLLDVQTNPRKPQYNMASELPLNLFDVQYDSVQWHCDATVLQGVVETLQRLWTQTAVRSAMLEAMLGDLTTRHGIEAASQTRCLTAGVRPRVYTPLLQRPTCDSLEEKVDHYVKRRKLDPSVLGETVATSGGTIIAQRTEGNSDTVQNTDSKSAAVQNTDGKSDMVQNTDSGSDTVQNTVSLRDVVQNTDSCDDAVQTGNDRSATVRSTASGADAVQNTIGTDISGV